MASFIGGEALASVVSINISDQAMTAFSIHTVTAGRYAKVFIETVRESATNGIAIQIKPSPAATSSLHNLMDTTGGGIFGPNSPQNINAFWANYPNGFYMDEGSVLEGDTLGGNVTSITAVILEFNKP